MDYKSIYDRFIKSRLNNPPSEDEYFERHHIVPRCMGGSDDPENLIPLIPEDHFFAHICLARANNSFELWAPVRLMLGKRSKLKCLNRFEYGKIRREVIMAYSGKNNPSYNKDLVTLKHLSGRIETLTRLEWAEKYNLRTAISSILNGSLKSCYGWMLPCKQPADVGYESIRTKTKLTFINKDGVVLSATVYDWINIHGLDRRRISKLLNGKSKSHHGWRLPETKIQETGRRHIGKRNHRYNEKNIELVRFSDGLVRKMKTGEWRKNHKVQVSVLIGAGGTQKTTQGWGFRPEYDKGFDARYVTGINKKVSLVNENGEVETLTSREWKERHGIWNGTIPKLLRGEANQAKGWRLFLEK